MAAAARRDGREREVAAFDEGELWCSDEADPALSPAGWYFRPRRGSQPAWIGPYECEEDAALAPFSGDSLRDARRRLDAWRRGDSPPPVRLVVAEPASAKSAPPPPVAAPPVIEVPMPSPPTPSPAAPSQFALDLGGQVEAQAPARPRAGRRRDATAEQISFGF